MLPFNSENHVKNLPDIYRKGTESNNFKILEVERLEGNGLREALETIDTILDLDEAYGKTLDYYGERVGQPRGRATDSQYLLMIKSKIMQNICDGTSPNIINAVCMTFNCDASQVHIAEDTEPCSVKIVSLPLSIINKAGLSTEQTVAMIKRLLPVGVALSSFLFDGTFEFGTVENEQDTDKGFCDVEGGTIGGYFGVTGSDVSDVILPI